VSSTSQSPHGLRFGIFEIDLDARELKKNGLRVKLQEQPFKILAAIARRAGEVIPREELYSELSTHSTYDSKHGLNNAIQKIREVLGDSPENARFIETVPGRGYRFLPQVEAVYKPLVRDTSGAADDRHSQAQIAEINPPIAPAPLLSRPIVSEDIAGTAKWGRRSWQLWRGLGVSGYSALGLAALVIAVLAGAWTWRSLRRPIATPASPVIRSLAVLPLENLTGDPSQEYFADGMTDALITDLAQIGSLRVISRTSMMRYKGTRKPLADIAQELGVEGIVEGTVFRSGNRVRITSQLIYAPFDQHLWARNYERDLSDIVALQGEVAQSIAGEVRAVLSPEQRARLAGTRTVNPEAYELYLHGQPHFSQRTTDGIGKSIEYFQRAVEKDPDFALAYAGLAEAYNASSVFGPFPPNESFPRAKAAATKALMLDPLLAEAHAALGMEMSFYEFDWPGALKEFLRALELNPNSAKAHRRYAGYLRAMKRHPEAIAEMEKAVKLDPLSPEMNFFLGMFCEIAGDHERALQQYRHVIEMDPNDGRSRLELSGVLAGLGKYEESIDQFEKGQILTGTKLDTAIRNAAALRHAFQRNGAKGYEKEYSALVLQGINEPNQQLGNVDIAAVYAVQGNKDKAFAWLEKAYQAREGIPLSMINSEPTFQSLHGDPRYSDLLRRLGLPE
jgi:TolB-like protein/DNA-binding winged helix-turn-helix (wHTH) protein/Flp pilus assembly protein TadD